MYTKQEVISYIRENDVKFIRLAFCDIFGKQKNISIMPDAIEPAFERGIPINGSSVAGFGEPVDSDIFLFPDPATLSILPWRPQQGRVVRFFCDVKNPDGSDSKFDTRRILKQVIGRGMKSDIGCKVGSECEFYLFKTDEEGNATNIPYDNAGYCDVAPLDKGENIRREVCLTLEEMGIKPESSHHELGPGQNEIDFEFANPLKSADNLVTFKSVVSVIAARNGLSASFEPKPIIDKSGNALHINISLYRNGENIFDIEGEHGELSKSFVAGVLKRIKEITVFLNSKAASYERLGGFGVPQRIGWAFKNRSELIRIPSATGKRKRMELRSPDPLANPYLAYALIISAGLEGIENGEKLMDNTEFAKNVQTLPTSLEEAVSLARQSEFVKSVLGHELAERYVNLIG